MSAKDEAALSVIEAAFAAEAQHDHTWTRAAIFLERFKRHPSRLALARALVPEILELLKELADDLEAETENRFGFPGETSPYHSENIRKRRDLEPVRRARAMLTAAEEPPHGP